MLVYLFKQIVNLSITGSIVAAIILILKLVCGKRFSARWNYLIWMLLFVKLTIPISASSSISLFNFVPGYSSTSVTYTDTAGNVTKNAELQKNNSNTDKVIKKNGKFSDKNTKDILIKETQKGFDFWLAGAIVWIIGSVLLIGLFTLSYVRVYLKLSKRSELDNCDMNKIVETCRAKAKVKKSISIYFDNSFESPCAFGIIRPKIIFPEYLLKIVDHKAKRYMIFHEIMHIKGKDNLINVVAMLLQAIYWFNPLIWYSFKCFRRACESACDERVMSKLQKDEYGEYALTLITLAEEQRRGSAYNAVLAFGETNIKERVKYIMKFRKKSFLTVAVAVTITIFTSAMLLTDAKTINNKMTTRVARNELKATTTKGTSGMGSQSSIGNITKDGVEYTNNKLGFKLKFPAAWNGNYILGEYGEYISVKFTGKSKKSKGLNMFFIGTKKAMDKFKFYDSPRKLATINKTDIYYYSRTDLLIDPESEKSIDQRRILEADYKKFRDMEKYIPTLLNTFKVIK